MSGIINSVGARSGIIGSTEIPGGYEEGTWIPANDGTAGTSSIEAKYTKIGRLVVVTAYLNYSGTSTVTTISGLPFTSGGGNDDAVGSMTGDNFTFDQGHMLAVYIQASAAVIKVEPWSSAGGLGGGVTVTSASAMRLTVSYMI